MIKYGLKKELLSKEAKGADPEEATAPTEEDSNSEEDLKETNCSDKETNS